MPAKPFTSRIAADNLSRSINANAEIAVASLSMAVSGRTDANDRRA
jgi:hypothetical protein